MAPKLVRTIADMQDNEIGYTLPWALDCEHIVPHDLTLNLVIRGGYPVYAIRGMGQMMIQKVGDKIRVYESSVKDYKFHFSGHPMPESWKPFQVEWMA